MPSGVAVDKRGDLFIADLGNNVVEEVTPAGRLSVVAGTGKQGAARPGPARSSDLCQPDAVAVDNHGDVFISDGCNFVVEKVTPAGGLSIVAGNGTQLPPRPGIATSSPLGIPNELTVDTRGDLFIVDARYGLLEVTPLGRLAIVAGGGTLEPSATPQPATSVGFTWPHGVAVDTHGDLFIAASQNYCVVEVTPKGWLWTVAGVCEAYNPKHIHTGVPRAAGPATSSQLDYPIGLGVDADGDLFIADPSANVIEKVPLTWTPKLDSGRGLARLRPHRPSHLPSPSTLSSSPSAASPLEASRLPPPP